MYLLRNNLNVNLKSIHNLLFSKLFYKHKYLKNLNFESPNPFSKTNNFKLYILSLLSSSLKLFTINYKSVT